MASASERPIVVMGCRGLLGRALLNAFGQISAKVLGVDVDDVDITNAAAVIGYVDDIKPQMIINGAAYTQVDNCESHRAECFRVNALGAGNVARAAAAAGSRLIHISTDYVFDGRAGRPYREEDIPNPESVYGAGKLEGERQVQAAGGRYLIVRTAWLFGSGGPDFVTKILARCRAGESLRVVDDQYGSPTYAGHLAEALGRLIALDIGGILHVAGSGIASWYEVAAAILTIGGFDTPLAAIKTPDYPLPAPRPANSSLACGRYEIITGTRMPMWREGLAAYLRALGVAA